MNIVLVNYDETWPSQFAKERDRLHALIAPWMEGDIEHVGSTSVPGMIAKPIIDIMVGVNNLKGARGAIDVLSNNGYCYYPYKPEQMHWFCRPSPEFRTHHVHLIPYQSPLWFERINFRDILRTNDKVAGQYAHLKQTLAQTHRHNRETYTQQKWPFIEKVLASVGSS
ncbi:GrpB family protein [Pseudoalteromonas luteoviolacea]|uniref:GrpB family protein n=1 Tax=Pseudoalteromonas luteoviolacea TaxID=43657 RepID=UPI001F3E0809|nr:GrpB family protein [Pseudoalteromonas luteoviolacea]MCF6441298.1 GrpB family protein [Pseudoalteromonas luteoviolacea]